MAGYRDDLVAELYTVRAKLNAAEAQIVVLQKALTYYADESIYPDFDPATCEWNSGTVAADIARAALTADDKAAAERVQALERVAEVAEMHRRIEYPQELIEALDAVPNQQGRTRLPKRPGEG